MDELGFTTDMCGQAFSGAGHGDVRNVVVCPLSGKVGRSVHNHAIELTRFFSGNREFLDMPKKLKMAFTACGTDCVRVEINDLSFVGMNHEGRICPHDRWWGWKDRAWPSHRRALGGVRARG